MKAKIGAVIIIIGIAITVRMFLRVDAAPVVAQPTVQSVSVEPTAAPTVTATATAQPISGDPVRVQFDLGSYGETITGTVSTRYLLWAAAGQVFTTTLSSNTAALASLYAPDGVALYQELAGGYTAAATLPASGDYRLEIRSSGNYTVGVEIR